MNNENKLPVWTSQAKQMLDESTENLDAATLTRLNRARQSALESARPRRLRSWFVPAGLAGACAILLAVAVVWHRPAPQSVPDPFLPNATANFAGTDLDLVSSDDSIEFYQDLDFYAWLETQGGDNNG
jgi:hypothetical protein